MPDTIVINDTDLPPMWFYSSTEGYVYRTDLFNYKNVVAKLSKHATHEDELVAVFKQVLKKFLKTIFFSNDFDISLRKTKKNFFFLPTLHVYYSKS